MPEIVRCPNCERETYLRLARCPHCNERMPAHLSRDAQLLVRDDGPTPSGLGRRLALILVLAVVGVLVKLLVLG